MLGPTAANHHKEKALKVIGLRGEQAAIAHRRVRGEEAHSGENHRGQYDQRQTSLRRFNRSTFQETLSVKAGMELIITNPDAAAFSILGTFSLKLPKLPFDIKQKPVRLQTGK
jgi:hypothetical protein